MNIEEAKVLLQRAKDIISSPDTSAENTKMMRKHHDLVGDINKALEKAPKPYPKRSFGYPRSGLAVELALFWLSAAMDCEEFYWDPDQWECADKALELGLKEIYKTHVTEPGESLMGIALRNLGNEHRWKEISILNRYRFPEMLGCDYYPVGTEILLPERKEPTFTGKMTMPVPSFEEVWEAYTKKNGIQYGKDATENAKVGYNALKDHLLPTS